MPNAVVELYFLTGFFKCKKLRSEFAYFNWLNSSEFTRSLHLEFVDLVVFGNGEY